MCKSEGKEEMSAIRKLSDTPVNNTRFKRNSEKSIKQIVQQDNVALQSEEVNKGIVAIKKQQLVSLWCQNTPQVRCIYQSEGELSEDNNWSKVESKTRRRKLEVAFNPRKLQFNKTNTMQDFATYSDVNHSSELLRSEDETSEDSEMKSHTDEMLQLKRMSRQHDHEQEQEQDRDSSQLQGNNSPNNVSESKGSEAEMSSNLEDTENKLVNHDQTSQDQGHEHDQGSKLVEKPEEREVQKEIEQKKEEEKVILEYKRRLQEKDNTGDLRAL